MTPRRTYTNSKLVTARSCGRKYENKYLHRLDLDLDEEREVLAVGNAWHAMHEADGLELGSAYARLAECSPSPLWTTKLGRLYAAHAWYWQDDPFEIIEPEHEFEVTLGRHTLRGKIDAIVRSPDGRVGVMERKTTSDSVEPSSNYWDRLALDTQVGFYGYAVSARLGRFPDFIAYDVVRKPTINPKGLTKADVKRLAGELAKTGVGTYFGETFDGDHVAAILDADEPAESHDFYGARLTSDIGDRPGYYFGRRNVPRTSADYATLIEQVGKQIALLEVAEEEDLLHRNPEACATYGLCEYFRLCSHGIFPKSGDNPPEGFRVRDREHPELSLPPDEA